MARTDALFDLTGRVAVVTGGSRGLGREMVLAFAERGADVVIASRKLDACEAVAAEVRSLGRRALPVAYHAGRWDDADRLHETVYDEFGRCDVLGNNAGMSPLYDSLTSVSEKLFDSVMNLNFKGPFRLSALVGERMVADGGGSIINTSSIMGIVGSPTTPAYSAAKGAIRLFTKSAALQYAKENIRVNSIHPGYATTPLTAERFSNPAINKLLIDKTPMGRLGTAEDIANGVLFLASDESAWMTGTELVIDGGMTAQ